MPSFGNFSHFSFHEANLQSLIVLVLTTLNTSIKTKSKVLPCPHIQICMIHFIDLLETEILIIYQVYDIKSGLNEMISKKVKISSFHHI